MELLEQKLWPATVHSWLQGLTFYFSVKMRLWFSEIVSSENILNHSTCSPLLSAHLNTKPKKSLMLLIMLLFLHLILAFLTCPSCLLQWACIPSSYIFIIFASRPLFSSQLLLSFSLCSVSQFRLWTLSSSLWALSVPPILLLSLSLITSLRAYSLTLAPFHSRHLLLDHSQNLGIASNCFLNTSISFPHLLTYPSLLYSTWSLVFQIAFLLFTD